MCDFFCHHHPLNLLTLRPPSVFSVSPDSPLSSVSFLCFLQVIRQVDEQKNETIRKTWQKVDKDFGSIFSTLLPGAKAKLDPVFSDEETAEGAPKNLTGLQVRVGFGDVWKESLSELSGGQRSLVALSMILALLMFKPAPMYILDEVDAALDLSHTQNIGHMLRTHFSKSQFIVVSLKEGMFNNANTIFRTKFVDGVSTVSRTMGMGAEMDAREAADAENEEAAPRSKKQKAASSGRGKKASKASSSRRAVASS